jgi:TatD DNase family protein
MLIDTHSHINFFSFDKDRKEVIERSLNNNTWMINVGVNLKTSREVVDIAQGYEGVYAAVGLHPIDLDTGLVNMKLSEEEIGHLEKEFNYSEYKKLAENEKVVAIGEIGLDYYWKPKTTGRLEEFKQKQKELLLKELDLAKELNLPVIIHCRMAHNDLIEILESQSGELRGVIHCFTGDWDQAKKYMDMGFYLGFNGIIFKLNLDEIIKKTPLDKILIETDCPYLVPPEAKVERNEPFYVKYVADHIAKIKGIDFDEVSNITTQNTKNLFRFD